MDKILERIVEGGMRLTFYACMAIMAFVVFLFLGGIGFIIGSGASDLYGGVVLGLIVGVGGTVGIAWFLHAIGRSF